MLDKNHVSKEDGKFTIEDNCWDWEGVNMLIVKSKIADWKKTGASIG